MYSAVRRILGTIESIVVDDIKISASAVENIPAVTVSRRFLVIVTRNTVLNHSSFFFKSKTFGKLTMIPVSLTRYFPYRKEKKAVEILQMGW